MMGRSSRAAFALLALLVFLGGACSTPSRRIPFQGDSGWRASFVSGVRTSNDDFVDTENTYALELLLDEPGTGGWGTDVSLRYSEGEGSGNRRAEGGFIVPADRKLQYYEVDFGARQVFRPDEHVQPYVGVGMALQYWKGRDTFVDDVPAPVETGEYLRGKIRPGVLLRTGLIWNVLNNRIAEDYHVPVSLDGRMLLGVDESYFELTLGFGFGK